jgi:hypothetical protein
MVDVSRDGERFVFTVLGLHKLWAFTSRLEIPVEHVTGVTVDPDQVGRWWHGWRWMGTDVPGLFAAGTFHYHGEMVFWDVRDPARTIIVSLEHEHYRKLIIEVEDPLAAATLLRSAAPA